MSRTQGNAGPGGAGLYGQQVFVPQKNAGPRGAGPTKPGQAATINTSMVAMSVQLLQDTNQAMSVGASPASTDLLTDKH